MQDSGQIINYLWGMPRSRIGNLLIDKHALSTLTEQSANIAHPSQTSPVRSLLLPGFVGFASVWIRLDSIRLLLAEVTL